MRFSPVPKAVLFVVLSLGGWGSARADDIVLRWNGWLRETMKRDSDHANPGYSTRAMAMVNGAVYDVFQAVQRTHRPFKVDMTASPTANLDAAASAAAYPIIKAMYPAETYFLTWSYRNTVDPIPAGPDKAAGLALGEAVAAAYLAWRAEDGHDSLVPYEPGTGPGKWQPDPDFFPAQVAWGPEWGAVETFFLTNSRQFQPPRVPALTSDVYTAAFKEIVEYGSADSELRTPDQFQIGLFWAYDRPGMGPPPVLYNRHVAEICIQRGTGVHANARLFALASVAMADAAICAWDAKFVDDFWRPVTAVRAADTDGNPDTEKIEDWRPQGAPGGGIYPDFTPPFPSYVSGHASMGGAVFQSLKRFFGTDAAPYWLTSDEVAGGTVKRYYNSFSHASQENCDSRVYLGVHWRFDQTEGEKLGQDIADYVAANAFQPVVETYADFAAAHGLTGTGSDDFDKDGCSDFGEYAFGTDPHRMDSPPGAVMQNVDGVPSLVLRYKRQSAHAAAGVALVPQISSNLTDWTVEGITDTPDPDRVSTAAMEYRCACVAIVPGTQVFLRLKAQM